MSLPAPLSAQNAFSWLAGGGEMGERIRTYDWSRTPLGPVETWSPTLRTMVSLLLANRFPLLLWWGSDLVQIYNDAYVPIPGTKHPKAMGQAARECWPEIWHIIGPLVEKPFAGGPATWMEDILLEINRHGFVEECHFTIAYSPVPDETAPRGIGGVLAMAHEITEKVVAARRVAILRELGARVAEAKTAEESCALAAEALSKRAEDVPFALLYLLEADGTRARLAGAAGTGAGAPFSPHVVDLDDASANPWGGPLAEAVRTETLQVVQDLGSRFSAIPTGPWSDPPHTAVVVPIKSNVAHQLAGVLVAGVSSRLRLDDLYRSFFELAATQIAAVIANARAYEEERKRAEALAEIDRAKTAFFSNVSHEFRTPLTLMLGPIEDALADPTRTLSPPDRDRLETAERNALRLLKLVNTLLDFSRIEAGRMQASYAPVDLAALTAELAGVFRSAIERAGLAFRVECPPLPQPIHVDRELWEKIVFNLLSNAFKFTMAGEIAVRLRWTGAAAELTVSDTGTGIAPEHLPRIFERFHRVPNPQSRTHEGSGIGLALTHELVRQHGGTLTVESAPGTGTAFTVSLPGGTAHLPAHRIAASSAPEPATAGARAFVEEALRWLPDVVPADGDSRAGLAPATSAGKRHRIVWADDNADMRDYVARLLGRHWTVESAADGEAALEAIRRAPPDLIVTDIMMPKLDGLGLLEAVRADPRTRAIPVIVLSARAGEEATVEGLDSGADDYLVKPFSARELIARVRTQLAMAEARRDFAERQAEADTRLSLAVKAVGLGVWQSELGSGRLELDGNMAAMFGFGAEPVTVSDADWMSRIHPDDRPGFLAELEARRIDKRPLDAELRVVRLDGTVVWLSVQGHVIRHGGDAASRSVGVARDVTDRKRDAERQQLLLNELNHRVRNSLATVLSLARQTALGAATVPAFLDSFQARVMALAAAHNLLTRSRWEGASLRDLAESLLAPERASDPASITLDGPPCSLSPGQALAVTMGLHELATNARKYGAFSARGGHATFEWTFVEADGARGLKLDWIERGGPPVRPPDRTGFGTRLLERALGVDLGGAVKLDFDPAGLRCSIRFPLARRGP